MRNEDLDPARARAVYARAMLEDLAWLGISWEEGSGVSEEEQGAFAPYRQSACRPVYLRAWRELVERGWVYPCRCSRRELRQVADVHAPHEAAGEEEDSEPVYPGFCRPGRQLVSGASALSLPEGPAGVNWRFRVPDGERVSFTDGHYGQRAYTAGVDFGDFLVWRRDDVPAYQLAVVADDARMGMTEVVRGADLLKSTARQLLLYRALELEPPAWFHCPLVVDERGQRLAKRTDALSIRALREQGMTAGEVLRRAGVVEPLAG